MGATVFESCLNCLMWCFWCAIEKTCWAPCFQDLFPTPGQAYDDQIGEKEHRQGSYRVEREENRCCKNLIQKQEIHARWLESKEESRFQKKTFSLRAEVTNPSSAEEGPDHQAAQIRPRSLKVSSHSLFSEIKLIAGGTQPSALHSQRQGAQSTTQHASLVGTVNSILSLSFFCYYIP